MVSKKEIVQDMRDIAELQKKKDGYKVPKPTTGHTSHSRPNGKTRWTRRRKEKAIILHTTSAHRKRQA